MLLVSPISALICTLSFSACLPWQAEPIVDYAEGFFWVCALRNDEVPLGLSDMHALLSHEQRFTTRCEARHWAERCWYVSWSCSAGDRVWCDCDCPNKVHHGWNCKRSGAWVHCSCEVVARRTDNGSASEMITPPQAT